MKISKKQELEKNKLLNNALIEVIKELNKRKLSNDEKIEILKKAKEKIKSQIKIYMANN